MGHSAGHHIEHAEHFEHAAHDEFNTKVTISIAIIAAVLAGVTIQGHKAHNLMLSHQVEATTLKAEAAVMKNESAIKKNESANKWSQFQAYNIRRQNYMAMTDLAGFIAVAADKDKDRDEKLKAWASKIKQYEDDEMPTTRKEAEDFAKEAETYAKNAVALEEQSAREKTLGAHYHHKADRLDLGDLGLQLGVVLASLAILTKRKSFWFLGIAAAVIGFAIAATGLFGIFLGEHPQHAEHPVEQKTELKSEHKGH